MQKLDIEINEAKEQMRREKMLQEYCKDPQIEKQIKMWIASNGQMVRPPIFFDVEKDRWFWANRAKRKQYMKQEKRNEKKNRNSKSSSLVGVDGRPLSGSGNKPVQDAIFNAITKAGKTPAFEGERYDTETGIKTPCREVTEINGTGYDGPHQLAAEKSEEGTNVPEANGLSTQEPTANL